ncbi:hypothetical protein [Streptomyces niveus]|uniref:hypothetical protein n=1 Tax=Streptomyces niveus TaxID=193462 RepID=UPI0034321C22
MAEVDPGASPASAPLGGQRDLASSSPEKKAAAKAIGDHIERGTKRAGGWADDETNASVKAFGPKDGHGWLTSGAIEKAHKTWGTQVLGLMARLASDKEALLGANTVLLGTDHGIESQVRTVSSINGY